MNRFLVVALLALGATAVTSSQVSAGYPAQFGFVPFGFYQPYGARFGTTLRTPPYFALNPPVYYGARYARPYGVSPFASPPLVLPNDGYRSRLRSKFSVPSRINAPTAPLCNPCVSHSAKFEKRVDVAARGPVRTNPFVGDTEDQLAQN